MRIFPNLLQVSSLQKTT